MAQQTRRRPGLHRHRAEGGPAEATGASAQDLALVGRLLAGDEDAFMWLVDRHHASMLRLARMYVPTRAVAEDVVQETWLAVLEGLPRFEGRSSLKTWIFRILMNRAMTRGARERRSIPFSSLFDPTSDPGEPSVDPSRFAGPDARGGYRWTSPPQPWDELPEARLDSRETLAWIRDTIEALPASQREVITLRDVDGWTPAEVCTVLQITDANQRVLLHRARSKVRRALERYLDQSVLAPGEGTANGEGRR